MRETARSSSRPTKACASPTKPRSARSFRRTRGAAGDLSSVTTAIRNPATGQPFPGNRIPVNPVSARVLDLFYERQNQQTGSAIDRPNLIVNAPGEFTVDGLDARGDYVLSPSQKMFGRVQLEERRQARGDRELEHEARGLIQAYWRCAKSPVRTTGPRGSFSE